MRPRLSLRGTGSKMKSFLAASVTVLILFYAASEVMVTIFEVLKI